MSAPRIFVIGATGAQGLPVCKGLTQDGAYSLRVLTRSASSGRAAQLRALGDVEFVEGTFASEADLRRGLAGCWGAFVNVDGFNSGEKAEMFWSMRAYELALEAGLSFFVFASLDYAYKKAGYDPALRAGHYDAKGRVGEWILRQNADNRARMGAALFTTGPYIEMAIAAGTPMTPTVDEVGGGGVVTWRVPLGDGGAVAHVALDDCAHYVRWLFDHRERASGMDLEVAIAHITYADLAAAFEKVTGRPARWVDVGLDAYFDDHPLSDQPAGYNADPADPATISFRSNFTGFWNIWRRSGGNEGVVRRDYQLLDEIHPHRIRSAEDYFRIEDKKGRESGLGSLWDRVQAQNLRHVLKITEDNRQGRL